MHLEKARNNQKLKTIEDNVRIKEIDAKGQSKMDAVVAVKEAWKRDVDTYKEMKQLKKQDQVENLKRGKAMHSLYK